MVRTEVNNPRQVILVSDCGRYVIKGRMVAESDCYSQDNYSGHKSYTGSHWVASIYCEGKPIKGIQVKKDNYQPYITIDNVCDHGMKLSKNMLLFIADVTKMFENALKDVDVEKVRRNYYKEYVKAREADGTL